MLRTLSLALAIAPILFAQQPTFRTGISMVEVDVQVFDSGGVIDNLTRADFAVKDNGRPVELRDCTQQETSLDAVLLFDLAAGMRPNVTKLRTVTELAMSALRPGDRAAAFSFNAAPKLEVPLTGDLAELKRRVRLGLAAAAFSGRAEIADSIQDAADYLASTPSPHGRRVILVFSDNAGFSFTHHAIVIRRLWNSEIIVSSIVTPSARTRFLDDANPYVLFGLIAMGAVLSREDLVDDIAEQTGGEAIYIEGTDSHPVTPAAYLTLRQSIARLRRRYRLYYDMPHGKPGERRRVQVELSPAAAQRHPGAHIAGRKGYIMPKR